MSTRDLAQTQTPQAAATQTQAHNDIDRERFYDAIIIGSGPSGLTASIYLARARARVLVLEKGDFGGQITITQEVVNYPGIERISGRELTQHMKRQAESFGAEFMHATVTGLDCEGTIKRVHTTEGDFSCFSVLLALGSHPRKIGFPGEEKFKGHGVAYCATCDGEFFTGKDIFVVGGGFAAAEESVFLTKYARHVYILIREDDFTCAEASTEEARTSKDITILTNTEVEEVTGDAFPQTLLTKNNKTGERRVFKADEGSTFGVFVLAGYAPQTDLVKDVVALDHSGNIVVDSHQETSCTGVYAAGDCCVKDLRQVVTATGDAATAAVNMERVCVRAQKQTGIVPTQPKRKTDTPAQTSASTSAQAQARATDVTKETSTHYASSIFDDQMVSQLEDLFGRMEHSVELKLFIDDSELSHELERYATELQHISQKIRISYATQDELRKIPDPAEALPFVRVLQETGEDSGLAFHGVFGGHEFTSFVLGLYNVAGPGQTLEEQTLAQVQALPPHAIKILVSLSCTMCPDTVSSAQRIAALNPHISVDVYDIAHFPSLKERYQAMSVPCIVIDDMPHPEFGRKDIQQMISLLA